MKNSIQIITALILWIAVVCKSDLFGQAILKPSIGLSFLPADNAPMCNIPLAIDSGNLFIQPGLHEGDTIPDFKLYTVNNDSMHIADLITDGKPVLLIGGSYTCPKYRNHLNQVNDLQAAYGSQIHIYIVYTVEAHPADPDISPYRGNVWELSNNDNLGIIYHEPLTYLDRKNTVNDMLDTSDIQVPVLLDGTCNEWWQAFALAPNPAFLINPNGTITKKQPWFDNSQYAMSNAIDSLLQTIPTGTEQVTHHFQVINNPGSPLIQFIFPEAELNAAITVFDSMGRIVKFSPDFSGSTLILNKEGLIKGTYLFSIQGKGSMQNGKFLVQ